MDSKDHERNAPPSVKEFRAELADLGETQSSLARQLRRYGDYRSQSAIVRSIGRMATGDVRIEGVLLAFMTLLRREKARQAESGIDAEMLAKMPE